jgi:hypothetical protein
MVLYYLGFLPGIYTPTLLLGGTNQYKTQKDDLVGRGGVITIRLTNQNADDKAIAAAEKIYSNLRGAKVYLQVTSSTISKSSWWTKFQKSERQTLKAIFSCIAYFQTGGLDLDTSTIGPETLAVCHASSVFVAWRLLSDPLDVDSITGNIGKPGLVLLLSPVSPQIRKLDMAL